MCLPVNQKHPLSLNFNCHIKTEGLLEVTDCHVHRKSSFCHENECILCKGEYDIGRTPHVECRIDTGEHRTLRQNLRRHVFAHWGTIDEQPEQVAEITKHGVVEPASSPLASNVVL